MTDQPNEPTEGDPAGTAPVDPPSDDVEALKKRLTQAEETARKADAAAKQNAAAARKLAQMEDASKTEQQRAADAQRAAEERASKAEGELLRLRIAAEHNLSPADARRLIGTTEDELRTDAAAYAEEHKRPTATTAPVVAGRRPTEQLRGGADPEEPVEEMDPDKLAAQITATH
jgi:hypothetical protein